MYGKATLIKAKGKWNKNKNKNVKAHAKWRETHEKEWKKSDKKVVISLTTCSTDWGLYDDNIRRL